MKIIILGAGQVGGSLALSLANESNDITLVDTDSKRLYELQDRADLQTITGHASYPTVLAQAGARDADMIVALTNSDETNMVACQVAYTLFHTPTKIARVRTADYLEYKDLFIQEALPIDVLISPEILVSNYVQTKILLELVRLQISCIRGSLSLKVLTMDVNDAENIHTDSIIRK